MPDPAEIQRAVETWQGQGFSEAEIARMIERLAGSAAMNPAQGLKDRLDRIKSGEISAIPWPWPALTGLAPVLTPGSLTVLTGSPGASKSFAVLQCVGFWTERQIPCSVLALEGTRSQALQRCLAQFDNNSNLCDLAWIKENPGQVDEAFARHRDWLDILGQCIRPAGALNATYDDVGLWLTNRAKRGDRVCVVDPVTVADPMDRTYVADRRLVVQARRVAESYGCSVVFVLHPSKNHLGVGLDGLAGGAAYQRHSDGVLWLESHPESRSALVMTVCGRIEVEINRTMHLLKVRDGRGQGKAIGFRFDPQSLTLAEQGVILKDKKRSCVNTREPGEDE